MKAGRSAAGFWVVAKPFAAVEITVALAALRMRVGASLGSSLVIA